MEFQKQGTALHALGLVGCILHLIHREGLARVLSSNPACLEDMLIIHKQVFNPNHYPLDISAALDLLLKELQESKHEIGGKVGADEFDGLDWDALEHLLDDFWLVHSQTQDQRRGAVRLLQVCDDAVQCHSFVDLVWVESLVFNQ